MHESAHTEFSLSKSIPFSFKPCKTPMCNPELYYKHELHRYAKTARPELRGMLLLQRGNRLSITPVETAHWKFILSLA